MTIAPQWRNYRPRTRGWYSPGIRESSRVLITAWHHTRSQHSQTKNCQVSCPHRHWEQMSVWLQPQPTAVRILVWLWPRSLLHGRTGPKAGGSKPSLLLKRAIRMPSPEAAWWCSQKVWSAHCSDFHFVWIYLILMKLQTFILVLALRFFTLRAKMIKRLWLPNTSLSHAFKFAENASCFVESKISHYMFDQISLQFPLSEK